MKTLYVSDLDGTLLQSDETLSPHTVEVINTLVEQGVLFSYATARSYITAKKVTGELNAPIPLIVYNGAMIMDNVEKNFIVKNFFDESIRDVLVDLFEHDIFPIVYAFRNGQEKFSYIPATCTKGMQAFLDSRKGDVRTNVVETTEELREGEIFYLSCIDDEEKLRPFYEKYKDTYHCIFQRDIYSNEQWLEFLPLGASKANAIKQLKAQLGCEKVVVFGDGINDINMFEIADEAYAVSNAVDELKQIATAVIGSNNEDGVASWLEKSVYEIL